jgi:hypothetical protein
MMYNETAAHLKADLKQYREHLATMEREVSRAKAAIKLLEKTIKGLESETVEEGSNDNADQN